MTTHDGLHVAVVGAGFVGVALAEALVRRGCTVTIVARSRELSDASEVTYAWLNSHRKRPEVYQVLNQRGLRHWRSMFGSAHPQHVHWHGHTVVVSDRANVDVLEDRVGYLRSLGYPAEWTTVEVAGRELPIRVPADAIAADFPEEGHCEPGPIRAALIEQLERSGRCTWALDEAVEVQHRSITLRSGASVEADRLVIAAGNASADLLATAGFDLPMVAQHAGGPAWGFLAEARVPAHGLPRPVTTDRINLRPVGPDSLLLQALDVDSAAGPAAESGPAVHEEYRSRVVELLGREDVEISGVRVGHRVIPADGMTVAGPVDGDPSSDLWTVVTHSGITLAPFLAETVAREIVESTQDPVLDEFRPRRFARKGAAAGELSAPRCPGEQ
ncbi:NAD(P)/FAD-dependent oxidoreductase [Brachybacterium sacelli]|uniref:Glycine/D-amino acid oxidase-like deaminating enzyme n=1 Tax=Brachybacterium sacelli TaxID=173364 RepID=A0ABS4WZ43_9MICO|nr:FAD-binding oxidoreductase [Brachybacterium sacelli]MBP2381408.1 glycine/D-amino acid oxidase-like deaminating enzyme [Brachybacterium sacelli]